MLTVPTLGAMPWAPGIPPHGQRVGIQRHGVLPPPSVAYWSGNPDGGMRADICGNGPTLVGYTDQPKNMATPGPLGTMFAPAGTPGYGTLWAAPSDPAAVCSLTSMSIVWFGAINTTSSGDASIFALGNADRGIDLIQIRLVGNNTFGCSYGNYASYIQNSPLVVGTPVLIATYSANALSFYINGVSNGSNTGVSDVTSSARYISIFSPGDAQGFSSALCMVFPYALSSDQARLLSRDPFMVFRPKGTAPTWRKGAAVVAVRRPFLCVVS